MSTDPKEQAISDCWNRIINLTRTLATTDNYYDNKWHSIVHHIIIGILIARKSEWQATMVAYYLRLTQMEPKDDKKQYYDELLKAIDELVGLLND